MFKGLKKIFAVVLAFSFLLLNTSVFARDVEKQNVDIFINIYNEADKGFVLKNTSVSVLSESTVLGTIDFLKQNGYIKDYVTVGNILSGVQLKDESWLNSTPPPDNIVFYAKLNGAVLSTQAVDEKVKDGDIIEWVYGRSAAVTSSDKATEVLAKPQNQFTEEHQSTLNRATDYLETNRDTSTSYTIAMTCAGREIAPKVVAKILSVIRATESFDNPSELAKAIMLLTFSGYDAASYVDRLADFPSIESIGIFGAVNALQAYNSGEYNIAAEAVNTRNKLISSIIKHQGQDGGFKITLTSQAEIDVTAMTLTVLSQHTDNSHAKHAIELGFEFLAGKIFEEGELGYMGSETSESISQVIIAMVSNEILLDDPRFSQGGVTLLDRLLEYQKNDGGFLHLTDDTKSGIMSTEQAIIALSAVKKGGYPYLMNQNLLQIPETHYSVLIENTMRSISPTMIMIFVLSIMVVFALIFVILIAKKRKKRMDYGFHK